MKKGGKEGVGRGGKRFELGWVGLERAQGPSGRPGGKQHNPEGIVGGKIWEIEYLGNGKEK
jgi:hypothetical protein